MPTIGITVVDGWWARRKGAFAHLTRHYDPSANPSSSIIRTLFRSSRCVSNAPRASLIAEFGEASSNAAIIASGTALIQSATQNRNRLPGRGGGTFGDKHPEPFCGIRHAGSLPRRAGFVSRFVDAIGVALPSAGAAMQRHSWTNNRWTIFSPAPCRAVKTTGF